MVCVVSDAARVLYFSISNIWRQLLKISCIWVCSPSSIIYQWSLIVGVKPKPFVLLQKKRFCHKHAFIRWGSVAVGNIWCELRQLSLAAKFNIWSLSHHVVHPHPRISLPVDLYFFHWVYERVSRHVKQKNMQM